MLTSNSFYTIYEEQREMIRESKVRERVKWNLNQSFLVLLLNFSEGCSFLMFEESMAEIIYYSVSIV